MKTYSKIKLPFIIAILALLFPVQGVFAFGHPDFTSPEVIFVSGPDVPIPPVQEDFATLDPWMRKARLPGFSVYYVPRDTTKKDSDDFGGNVLSCKLCTKEAKGVTQDAYGIACGFAGWVDRGAISCTPDEINEVVLENSWCDVEGSSACGVRITVTDNGVDPPPANKPSRLEHFFSIDLSTERNKTETDIIIIPHESDPTQKTSATFTFFASDPYDVDGGTFECKMDTGSAFSSCTSPVSYSGLPDGVREFTVRVKDIAGNIMGNSFKWTIDSTPPEQIKDFTFRIGDTTYFSTILDWLAPGDDGASGGPSSQYDIRYSVEPVTKDSWDTDTAIVYEEPYPPKFPGSAETMQVGPKASQEASITQFTIGDLSNLLASYTGHYFGIRARDEKWNWSDIATIGGADGVVQTRRDPCDYDADRVFSGKDSGDSCGPNVCNPNLQSCDLYDNPYHWDLPEANPGGWSEPGDAARTFEGYGWTTPGTWAFDKENDFWISTFAATVDDLDCDGEGVAQGRLGLPGPPGLSEEDFPIQFEKKDWYDNPFTQDLTQLTTRPNFLQLEDTINDLDLDTYALQSWADKFDGSVPTEPDDKDFALFDGVLTSGCYYPKSLEDRCDTCTAYVPEVSTGRIPPLKIAPSVNNNWAVCQIEAYYTDIAGEDPPYEVIPVPGEPKGTLDPSRPIITASAQCKDGVDNNLNGKIDDDEKTCPTEFNGGGAIPSSNNPIVKEGLSGSKLQTAALFDPVGIIQCGRNADDLKTPIDESADCNLCHLLFLFDKIMKLILYRILPVAAALALVVAGFLILTSGGVAERAASGKRLIRWAFLAVAFVFLVWMVLSTFFSLFGIQKWTGFFPVSGEITAMTPVSISDNTKTWEDDEWLNFVVEIFPPDSETGVVRKIESNTADTLTLTGGQPFVFVADPPYTYHILGTGWWSFVCGVVRPPLANFSASPNSGIAPFLVDFTDLSIGDITGWFWDFGDGNTSTKKSPRNTYTTNGPHTVTLTVTGPGGKSSKSLTIYYSPTADFTAKPRHGRPALEVTFDTTPTQGQVIRWEWDFGDGTTQSVVNSSDFARPTITHTYTEPGPYLVKLKAVGPAESDKQTNIEKQIFVYPAPEPPIADFEWTAANSLAVVFKNTSFLKSSLDQITGWKWDFGDGNTSAVQDPTHYFMPKTEPYKVTLIAIGPGTKSLPFTKLVSLPPTANFWIELTSGVAEVTTFQFHDESLGTVNKWEWDFGDGTIITGANPDPTHVYAKNGRYTIVLRAFSPDGSFDKKVMEKYIAVAPRADFSFASVLLSNHKNPPDAQTYIQNPPNTNCATPEGCTVGQTGAEVTFKNDSTCFGNAEFECVAYWEFGDGTVESVDLLAGLASVSHKYLDNEDYDVRLIMTGPGGSNTVTKKGNETRRGYAHIAPYANFDTTLAEKRTSAASGFPTPTTFEILGRDSPFTFLNLTDPDVVHVPVPPEDPPLYASVPDLGKFGWFWEFGDGAGGPGDTSTERDPPTYTYPKDERYTVTLKATGPGGIFTEKKVDYVIFPPVADFTRSPNLDYMGLARGFYTYCPASTVTFTADNAIVTVGEVQQWAWLFGDGAGETVTNSGYPDVDINNTVTYCYPSAAKPFTDYTVRLTDISPGGEHPDSLAGVRKHIREKINEIRVYGEPVAKWAGCGTLFIPNCGSRCCAGGSITTTCVTSPDTSVGVIDECLPPSKTLTGGGGCEANTISATHDLIVNGPGGTDDTSCGVSIVYAYPYPYPYPYPGPPPAAFEQIFEESTGVDVGEVGDIGDKGWVGTVSSWWDAARELLR